MNDAERSRRFWIIRERRIKKVEELLKIKSKNIDRRFCYWGASVPVIFVWLYICGTEAIELLMISNGVPVIFWSVLLYFVFFLILDSAGEG